MSSSPGGSTASVRLHVQILCDFGLAARAIESRRQIIVSLPVFPRLLTLLKRICRESDMVFVYWLLALGALASAGVFGYRLWRQRTLQHQLSAVQITSDLWRCVSALPEHLLPQAVRSAVVGSLRQAATRLQNGPFERYSATLAQQATFLSRGASNHQSIPEVMFARPGSAQDSASTLRTIEQLMKQAAAIDLITHRESAMVKSSLRLATEIANVEWLVQEARRAMILREHPRMEALKAQALAHCARLPAKTAEEVRKRVNSGLSAG